MNIPEDETPMDRSPDPDYEVGYGRPPKASQFRKGQSGNPKGRPKGKRGVKTILRRILSEKVTIHENGRPLTMTKEELLFRKWYAMGLKGDTGAMIRFSETVLRVFGADDETPPTSRKLDPEDEKIIAAFEARLKDKLNSEGSGET
jgi:Family of unknown function (DUF5681)